MSRIRAISNNRVEREVVDALVAFGARRLSAAVASLLPAEGALVRKEEACRIGTATRRCRLRRPAPSPGRRRRNMVLTAYRGFSPEMARDRRALLHRSLDRRAGAARQGAGRVLASDHAVGASLCADELPGQAARRDDARPRTRPRRASGAGGAERRADGADAADAGRNRQRVRRDADLQAAVGARPRTPSSARRCSPARSRT